LPGEGDTALVFIPSLFKYDVLCRPSHLQHPCPVLQRLSKVVDLDVGGAFEVSDYAADFEDAVVATGAEVHLAHGGAHEGLGALTQDTKFANLCRSRIGIAL
jgi:hypothetical protein